MRERYFLLCTPDAQQNLDREKRHASDKQYSTVQYSTVQYSTATHFSDVVRCVGNAGLRMVTFVMCALRVSISSVRTLTDVVRAQ